MTVAEISCGSSLGGETRVAEENGIGLVVVAVMVEVEGLCWVYFSRQQHRIARLLYQENLLYLMINRGTANCTCDFTIGDYRLSSPLTHQASRT
jgi:hypothetical protein